MNWLLAAPRRWRLVLILIAYLAGTVTGALFTWPVSGYVAYAGIGLLGLFCLARPFWLGVVFAALGASLIGFWWARSAMVGLTLPSPATYRGLVEVVSARLADPPRTTVRLKLLGSKYRGHEIEATAYDWSAAVGSIMEVGAVIEPADRAAAGRNVFGRGRELMVGSVRPPGPLARFRQVIIDRVGASLPEPQASLVVGLLTGVSPDFDVGFQTDLRRTGTAHIVAVSGANLTVVALLILRLSKRYGRWPALALALTSLTAYAVLAGFSPSVSRGLVMAGLALLASTLGRVSHRLPLILLTAAILSVFYPLGAVYSLSWQLSFFAFTGIIFLGPTLGRYFRRLGAMGLALGETLAADLFIVPLTLAVFGQVSVVGPLVNMVILLVVPIAMAASFGQVAAALVSIDFGRVFAWISYPILTLVTTPISLVSRLPTAVWRLPRPSPFLLAGLYSLVVVISWILISRGRDDEA